MPRRYIFADESGNFDFSKGRGASRYFILTTITANDCSAGQALLELRRELAWQGIGLGTEFHATTDTQETRNRVFVALKDQDFRVDATIMEKSKAKPAIRTTDEQFYKMAWHLHMKDLAPHLVEDRDELLVVGASVGTKKRRTAFHTAIVDTMKQVSPTTAFRVACWNAASDPCLQVADYCAWAIQRKWESKDLRSYVSIADKIRSEFEAFRTEHAEYY